MKQHMTKLAAILAFALAAGAAVAAQGDGHQGMNMGGKSMGDMDMGGKDGKSTKAGPMTNGEVKAVDKAKKSITLKHGDIEHMNMGSMTMAFPVKDAAMLSKVKVGDKVKFRLENVDNMATVTALTVEK
jgi:Cu/Ag efflux protein CusF